MIRRLLGYFFSACFGMFLLTACTWVEVHYKILEFLKPHRYGINYRIFAIYGGLFFLLSVLFPLLERKLTATFSFRLKNIYVDILAIIFAFTLPVSTLIYPDLVAYVFGLYVLIRLGFFHAKWDWLFFLIGALVGPTLCLLLTYKNFYRFSDSIFLDMPHWLPLAWGITFMSARRIVYFSARLVGR